MRLFLDIDLVQAGYPNYFPKVLIDAINNNCVEEYEDQSVQCEFAEDDGSFVSCEFVEDDD
jgi:hypothetical protein